MGNRIAKYVYDGTELESSTFYVRDYTPFGVALTALTWSDQEYRFGFQAQEQDNEMWYGSVTYKYRVEDPRLGRFFSVDPLSAKYPYYSAYQFSGNRSIDLIDSTLRRAIKKLFAERELLMKTNFLILVLIFTVVRSTCQTAADSAALDYFLDDANLSLFKKTELSVGDSSFVGNWIWYIESKNCPDYCFESGALQLRIDGDSLFWSKNGEEFVSTDFRRMHQESVFYSFYVIYEYYCGDTRFQLNVVGKFGNYYLIELFRSRKIFKRKMKLETRFIVKEN